MKNKKKLYLKKKNHVSGIKFGESCRAGDK